MTDRFAIQCHGRFCRGLPVSRGLPLSAREA